MANKVIAGGGFHHVALKVKDFAKSRAMYEALGLEAVLAWGEGDGSAVMLDMGDDARLELFAGGGDDLSENGKYLHFAMRCDDVEAAYKTAIAAGFTSLIEPKVVPVNSTPYPAKLNVAFVKGNDGEQVEFFRELK